MGISISGIKFGYPGGTDVLKGIEFSCHENRIAGIIGPNGCGKTTTLKVMAGYLHPSSGMVKYNSREISEIPSRECAKIRAVVEQKIHTPFAFPVYDYVMLGRMPYLRTFETEHDSDHEIVSEALESAQVLHLKDKKINALSGGELQRVMIARALAQRPQYLMLDEPTSHLDIRHQLELMKLLRNLSSEISVIMVIHELNHASLYCDDIILMKNGSIVAHGDATDVLNSAHIEEVFGVVALPIHESMSTGFQYSFSLPPKKSPIQGKKVHIISGGGIGGHTMALLKSAGFSITTGVLTIGDRDFETAQTLGIQVLSTEPFSPVRSIDQKELGRWIESADLIVLMLMDIGEGNIRNIESVSTFAGKKPIYLIGDPETISEHDYTSGRAGALYKKIIKNAVIVPDPPALIEEITSR